MNILVTGANGQLGNQMRLLGAKSRDHYIYTDVVAPEGVATTILDITNINNVRALCEAEQVDVIVNCAAYTNVDKAESDAEFCETLNAKAPENLAEVMKERGGLLASGCQYIIIRTAWLYSAFGRNFVKTMLNLTATKPALKVVFDQVGTPTFAGDLADVIFDIVENRKWEGRTGIYHYSNEGVCSWYDFTMKIAELAGNKACDIQPCHSDEFPSPVKRPAYSVLDKTKIKETFGIRIPYWTHSLEKCMKQIKGKS